MNRKNKSNILILIVLILAVSMSACTGGSSMTASGWAGITTDEDTAYLAFSSHIVAVNLTNGLERWRFPAEADSKISFYAAPEISEKGMLVAGGYDNVLYSINPDNGQGTSLFEGAEGRYIGGPLVTEEMIYAPSADHSLYAINMTGQELWHFETDKPLWATPTTDSGCNCIYLSSMDHRVYSLDAKTGALIWQSDDLGGAIVGTPTISDDNVLYVGTFANELVALDAATGSELYRFPTENWVWSGPVVSGDRLYFGDLSGTFYAINRKTGGSEWQIQTGGAIVGTPVVWDDSIYFTTENGTLRSVNAESANNWEHTFETNLHSAPVISGNMILVATSDPEQLLIAFDPSGVQKWSYGLESK
jgi:outer membrane protein assembly factor BamB